MADLMIGKTSDGKKLPILIDSTGKIQVGGVQLDNLNVNTDQIEAKQDTTNAILTTTAADLASVKNQLATGTVTVSGGGGGGGSSSVTLSGVGAGVTLPVSGTVTSGRNWNLAVSTDSLTAAISSLPAITGTVTANAGTNLNTSALALEAGNLATLAGKTSYIATPPSGTVTASGGTVTAGTPASLSGSFSKLLIIQNTAASGTLYVSTNATPSATNGLALPAGTGYEFPYVPTSTIYVAASTGSVTYGYFYA